MARPWARSPLTSSSEGVNLAEYATPMSRQAADVHKLTLQHNSIHFARWRMVQVPLDGQGFPLASAEIVTRLARRRKS